MTAKKKPQPGRTILDTFVAGVIHGDWDVTKVIPRGTVLNLEREPMNKADGYALKLSHKGVKIGYLPKQTNPDRADHNGYQPVWAAIRQGLPVRVTVMNYAPGNPTWYMIKVRCEVPQSAELVQTSEFAVPTF